MIGAKRGPYKSHFPLKPGGRRKPEIHDDIDDQMDVESFDLLNSLFRPFINFLFIHDNPPSFALKDASADDQAYHTEQDCYTAADDSGN